MFGTRGGQGSEKMGHDGEGSLPGVAGHEMEEPRGGRKCRKDRLKTLFCRKMRNNTVRKETKPRRARTGAVWLLRLWRGVGGCGGRGEKNVPKCNNLLGLREHTALRRGFGAHC